MQFCEIHCGTVDKSSILIETLHCLMGFEISGRGNKGKRGKKYGYGGLEVPAKGKKRRRKKGKKKQKNQIIYFLGVWQNMLPV